MGIDLSEGMLEVGREKIEKRGLADCIELKVGDAIAIPCEAQTFDATSISFGIRNVMDVDKGPG